MQWCKWRGGRHVPTTISTGARADPLDLDRPSPSPHSAYRPECGPRAAASPPCQATQDNQLLTETGNTQNRSVRHRLVAPDKVSNAFWLSTTLKSLTTHQNIKRKKEEKKKKEDEQGKQNKTSSSAWKESLGHLHHPPQHRTTTACLLTLA
ncbi:hypothetical protein VTI28DRAFT_8983 [Corynascus sepedonium]